MNYGCKKEIDDKRDYKLKDDKISKFAYFPESYEIKMPRIKNQKLINSCVAHSLSTFLEESYKDERKYFSVGFIYGYRPFGYSQEEGMYPREALKTLQKIGDVEEKDFPYNKEIPEIKEMINKNLEELKLLANNYKIQSYARIYDKEEILRCLCNDCPVPISIPVYNGLKLNKDNNKDNIVESPSGELEGYHMIILYGWNKDGYLLQNSWEEDWGNNGCVVLPYDYEIDSAWAISTDMNNIETKQTFVQLLSSVLKRISIQLKELLKKFNKFNKMEVD